MAASRDQTSFMMSASPDLAAIDSDALHVAIDGNCCIAKLADSQSPVILVARV